VLNSRLPIAQMVRKFVSYIPSLEVRYTVKPIA